MTHFESRRSSIELSPEQRGRLSALRAEISKELPDLVARDRLRREASEESTISGALRRAIHASALPLAEIANQAGIGLLALDEFLTGERTLRSDVIDRLAKLVNVQMKETAA